VAACLSLAAAPAAPPQPEYLSECPELLCSVTQEWGNLGLDTAAHPPDRPGAPLRIGSQPFAKGLGHHANGRLTVWLDGDYATFEAQVGLQPLGSIAGSVVFRVLVDNKVAFDSGVMREADGPKPIHLSVAGARELTLEANDAGDGINCDMANWAEARLTPAAARRARPTTPPVDVATSARVVTWDPNRTDGCRASRIEEFRAEDVFLEADVPADRDGCYTVPVATNGLGCIGLQWLNRRALKELRLPFKDAAQAPSAGAVQVQGWFGESAWQGQWKALPGTNTAEGGQLIFRLASRDSLEGLVQVQKVRWVLPPSATRIMVRHPVAYTHSRWADGVLVLKRRFDSSQALPQTLMIQPAIYNGMFLAPRPTPSPNWLNLRIPVRYCRPSWLRSDATVLWLGLESGACGVALDDVFKHGCVYVPDLRLLVTREPAPVSWAAARRTVSRQKSIRQLVSQMPDQTLAQAMAKTHHEAQREGPVMLSLACENTKFVVEREGAIQFQPAAQPAADWFASAALVQPRFGAGPPDKTTRHLDGGWLPIPVITVEQGGAVYCQRTFVAPYDEPGDAPARLNRRSVCVSEFSIHNPQAQSLQVSLTLSFLAPARQKISARLEACPRGFMVLRENHPIGLLELNPADGLPPVAAGGNLTLTGRLAPGQRTRCTFYLPGQGIQSDEIASLQGAERLRTETEAYWQAVLGSAMQVELPDAFLNNLIRSSQVRCLIAARNEADGARIAPWIAAMSYGPLESEAHSVIRGMDLLGHADFARRGLDYFIHRYNTNGFLTTGYTTFGTAWHLWTLGEHYQLTRDTNWLQQVAPEVARVGQWVIRQAERTKGAGRSKWPTWAVPIGGSSQGQAQAAQAEAPFTPALSPRERGANLARVRRGISSPPPGERIKVRGQSNHWLDSTQASAVRTPSPQPSPPMGQRGQPCAGVPPEYGLMPPGVMADWNAFAYHFCLNAYYYAGLRDVGAALGDIGRPEAALFAQQAAQLRTNILRAYRWTQARAPVLPLRNGAWVPHYPSQVHSPGKLADFFPGQDAGRSWCYDVELGAHQLAPTGVFAPDDPEVSRMLDHMEDVQFLADGWFDYPAALNQQDWFNLGGFSKVQPYYTRNAEIYALRDEVKPFIRSYFNTLAAMVNPEVLTIWEHFHHSGAWDKTHETGYFLQQTRFMLVMEHGEELWLAPLVTTNWLQQGMTIAVTNAPTKFGPVSYRITSRVAERRIEATVTPPSRHAPQAIVLRLRHPEGKPLRSVTVNGQRHRDFDRQKQCIKLPPAAKPITLVANY
jgi:hypothetical protein